jgi:glycosyltransferase involved in cell wall biosynthesis
MTDKLYVVLAHDSFTQLGGAEKVMDAFHEIFPEAPVYTLVLDKKLQEKYKGWDIRTSKLQKIYNRYPRFQRLLPLIPWAVGSLKVEDCDVLLSSSSGFIKDISKPRVHNGTHRAPHVNYCHAPTRFLWSDSDYVNQEVPFLLRWAAKIFLGQMRIWDYNAAQKVDKFIANSKEVQARIKKYYNRDSVVIYPPVDTEFWKPTIVKQDYFLLAGRLQAHKRNDLIVEIFNELGLPLHVVGAGRQEQYLRSIAKQNIAFYGRISDKELRDQYSGAKGFIYPQIEDAGLMPLEAAACGTATMGIAKGGTLETVIPGETGELFQDYDKEKIKELILSWDKNRYSIDTLKKQSEKFSKEKFKQQILNFLNENSHRP